MAEQQTYGSPIGAFLRGFQGARDKIVQQQQQDTVNQLTEQLRQIQMLNAQRQLDEASKPFEQKLQEAIALHVAPQAAQKGYLVQQAIPGEITAEPNTIPYTAPQLNSVEAASQVRPTLDQSSLSNLIAKQIRPSSGPEQPTVPTQLSDAMANITSNELPPANISVPIIQPSSQFVIPRAAPAQFQTNLAGTNLALSPTLKRQGEELINQDKVALLKAKQDLAPDGYTVVQRADGEYVYLPKIPGKGQVTQVLDTNGNPIESAQHAQFNERMDLLQQKQAASDSKAWDTLLKSGNPLTAPSRSVLGVVGVADVKVNRALKLLDKPLVTKQELGAVVGDLSSIIQSGSPTKYGMAEQDYSTLESKAAGWIQYLSGVPEGAVPDAIKNTIKEDLLGIKQQNKDVINQQLDIIEKTHPDMIHKKQKEWDAFRNKLQEGVVGAPIIPTVTTPTISTPSVKTPSGNTFQLAQ